MSTNTNLKTSHSERIKRGIAKARARKVAFKLNEMWPSKYDKAKGYIYLAGFEEGRKYEQRRKCPDCGSPKRLNHSK
jgi:hypothetical protein